MQQVKVQFQDRKLSKNAGIGQKEMKGSRPKISRVMGYRLFTNAVLAVKESVKRVMARP